MTARVTPKNRVHLKRGRMLSSMPNNGKRESRSAGSLNNDAVIFS
jgi:hypothetical protein